VLGASPDDSARVALADFRRFPAWMWRNTDVLAFVEWLRARNDAHRDVRTKARFFGLDLYSLRASIEAVVAYLDAADPAAGRIARERYSCFDHVRGEGPEYGHAVALDVIVPREDEVVAELVDLRRKAPALLARDGWAEEDELFYATQNAVLVRNAERYYRSMYRGRALSWNLRDRHMAETLEALADHLVRQLGDAKVVVWEHNSHIGDARATEMSAGGELNVGQLVRSRWPGDNVLVGFTTYDGEVTAASEWSAPAERKRVRPALAGSYEAAFHDSGTSRFLLPLQAAGLQLRDPRLERAIGVIYRPETERTSHWFHARLPQQFDRDRPPRSHDRGAAARADRALGCR
jgi:erythromycin esterase-like protein